MYEEFLIVATTSNTCVGAGGKLRNPGGNPRFRGNPERPPGFPKTKQEAGTQDVSVSALKLQSGLKAYSVQ